MAKRKEGEVLPTPMLWVYSANKEGKHPVRLRVNHQRNRGYYPIMLPNQEKMFLHKKEYDLIMETDVGKLRGKNRDLREAIDDAKARAKDAIEEATKNGRLPFSFGAFEKNYLGEESRRSFLQFFEKYLHRLAANGQAGTHRTYSSAYSAFKAFLNGHEIDPADLTSSVLYKFDTWLRESHTIVKNGKRIKVSPKNSTSVSIYMRALRTVYNELAVTDDYLNTIFPFSRSAHDKRYKIPASTGSKGEALTRDQMKQFIQGDVQGPSDPGNPIYRAKRLFIFSFLALGINFKDMALLKYSNIKSNTIEFIRAKTRTTSKIARIIQVPLTDDLKEIIVELGNPDKSPTSYVFQVFDSSKKYTEKEKDDLIRQWIKTTNKWLAQYSDSVGLPKISTYWARHTFASVASRLVKPMMIKEMMGHSRVTTTEAYISRFNNEERLKGYMTITEGLTKKQA